MKLPTWLINKLEKLQIKLADRKAIKALEKLR